MKRTIIFFVVSLCTSINGMNTHAMKYAQEELRRNPFALHAACRQGNLDKAKLLLALGASVNIRSQIFLETPLHEAVCNGNKDIVIILLKHLAPIEAENIDGCTPLHHAVFFNNPKMTKLLIDNHADVNKKCCSGRTPLHWAADLERAEYLHNPSNMMRDNATTSTFENTENKKKIIQLLLQHKADINAQDLTLWTPLHLALWREKYGIVEFLIEHNAFIDIQNDEGNTPVHLAAQFCSNATMELLLIKGNPSSEKITNRNDLQTMCLQFIFKKWQNFDNASLDYIVSCIGYNTKDSEDCSDIMWYTSCQAPLNFQQFLIKLWHEQKEKKELLVNAHIKQRFYKINQILNKKNAQSETPLDIAKKEKNNAMITLLSTITHAQSPADLDQTIMTAIKEHIEHQLLIPQTT